MRKWQKLALFGCGTCFLLSLCFVIAGFVVLYGFFHRIENFDKETQPWTERALPHPGETPAVTFMQRIAHPFLAEYDYKVRFGAGAAAVERWLPMNAGGRTRINAYWYAPTDNFGPCIRLQDSHGEYLLDLNKKTTCLILRYEGHVFAGEIADGKVDYSMGKTFPNSGEEEIHAFVGKNKATDITRTHLASKPCEYFGRVDGQQAPLRFIPVSQGAEIDINDIKMN